MPKKKPKQPATEQVDVESEQVKNLMMALVDGKGRGGLTWLAGRLGMTVSATRKRLRSTNAFDPVTMRAIMLAKIAQAEAPLSDAATRHGDYLVEIQDGEPRWQSIE